MAALPEPGGRSALLRLTRLGLFLPVGGVIVAFFVFLALFPGVVAHYNPDLIYVGGKFEPPGGKFLLGTDEVGRDLFSRLVYGTRISLGMSLAVVVLGGAIGVLIGAVAGFVGGLVDELLMRLVDLFLSLPSFILAIAIAAVLGRSTTSVVIALVIVWWPGYARLIRGIVLSVKQRLHVESARAAGASPAYIVRRHILPFTYNQLNARLTQDMGYALVSVAGLSFLGLGAQPPSPEWGALLNSGRDYVVQAWWYPLFPGLAITVWTLGVSMLGNAISGLGDGDRGRG
ncbi:MAG TPA: ABC transporter permease [Candidatus Dormibacteraeota bacterium]|jgi:peptide/nickel transport system permease protein|nr:ABC transporter permease [Candidatus Dormibacteraeota bacterium]